ncbi:hypothetical protein AWC38_SpisGene13426 [Stylophora pistillata]|uniref:Uncharacterized protein n=1 Tax=Stylophora pistillata TaxID=50429 RepID=A0A2B4RZU6_STYPI|nr:hypothetical protein AWC38_SpisGene13426 [Stylophora pistillata]
MCRERSLESNGKTSTAGLLRYPQKCLVNKLLNNLNKEKFNQYPPLKTRSKEIESKREKTLSDNTENQLVGLLAKDSVNYFKSIGIENPVEILRYAQSLIVTGRPLDVQDVTYEDQFAAIFVQVPSGPSGDFNTQMAKVAHGILSGKYATAPQEHQETEGHQTD